MTTRMITVRENDSIVEAVKKFAQYKVGRLLVVNDQGQLAGILTGGDITRGLLEADQPRLSRRGDQPIPGKAYLRRHYFRPDQPDPSIFSEIKGF